VPERFSALAYLQSTGQLLAFSPAQMPSPQQALLQSLPAQRQSLGHEKQSSPLPSQTLLPQTGPVAQAGSLPQSASLQSVWPSQSSSMPSVQLVSVGGGVPQSAGQMH
jgi:hypothetical protein